MRTFMLTTGLIVTIIPACAFLRGYAEGRGQAIVGLESAYEGSPHAGVVRFAFDDLGGLNTDTLETSAVPWKVIAAALVLDAAERDGSAVSRATLERSLRRLGFLFPRGLANWSPATPPPFPDTPLGLVSGYVTRAIPSVRVEVAAMGCASCHSGALYDAAGTPRPDVVWLGLPNTSFDPEAYARRAYAGLQLVATDIERLLRTITLLFPDVTSMELHTIRDRVFPPLSRRMRELAHTLGRPFPFSAGGPGTTNGVAVIKLRFGALAANRPSPSDGFVSIPDLGDAVFRSSLLADGLYAPTSGRRFRPISATEITRAHRRELARLSTAFLVATLGLEPCAAAAQRDKLEEIWEFLQSYRPPPFPGAIDAPLARRGRAVYDTRCAGCHGGYADGASPLRLLDFPNRLTPQAEAGTDVERWREITPRVIESLRAAGLPSGGTAAAAQGYVATRLSGVWATAPYLHNGSVPTLWHLLTPGERPVRFQVGGHRLDFLLLGIAGRIEEGTWVYPTGYQPWSDPDTYDTSQPGRSNAGHAWGSELSDADKQALIEFLKLL